MSVRKISELPWADVTDSAISANIYNSLLEISYSKTPDTTSAYWFESKYVIFGDILEMMFNRIVGKEDNPTEIHFYNTPYFHTPVYMLSGLNLSGNFYVNKNVSQTDLGNLTTEMYSGNTYINSVAQTSLSAPVINTYSNTFNIRNYANTGTDIAEFTNELISFNRKTNISSLACTNLSCSGTATFNGTATFKNIINGCALCARWADLAEGYETDREYEPGTFVCFGGQNEITISTKEANAVITTRPGLILGADGKISNKQNIALVGRTPVKVIGPVKKFDRLVLSDTPGVAMPQSNPEQRVVARALADSPEDGIHLVEAVVQLKL